MGESKEAENSRRLATRQTNVHEVLSSQEPSIQSGIRPKLEARSSLFWKQEGDREMPTLNLYTNVPVDTVVASDILKDATKAVAKIIGKPESVKCRFICSLHSH